jgi:hypothetical protein
VFLSLQGALTILWLISGYFFLIPVVIARFRYADRYATETFWRIPGGRVGAIVISLIGIGGTTAGIYYTFTLPFSTDIDKSTWMTNLGVICGISVVVAGVVFVLGRRSANKIADDQRLAHLAVLELPSEQAPA